MLGRCGENNPLAASHTYFFVFRPASKTHPIKWGLGYLGLFFSQIELTALGPPNPKIEPAILDEL